MQTALLEELLKGRYTVKKELVSWKGGAYYSGTLEEKKEKVLISYFRTNKLEANYITCLKNITYIKCSSDNSYFSPIIDSIFEDAFCVFVTKMPDGFSLAWHASKRRFNSEYKCRSMFLRLLDCLENFQNQIDVLYAHFSMFSIYINHDDDIVIHPVIMHNLDVNGFQDQTFSPPEVLLNQEITEATIVWKLGIMLYTMITSYQPFSGASNNLIYAKIVNGEFSFPSEISENLSDLLSKMILKQPISRITLDGIKQHPWILGGGSKLKIMKDYYRKGSSPSLTNKYYSSGDINIRDFPNYIRYFSSPLSQNDNDGGDDISSHFCFVNE